MHLSLVHAKTHSQKSVQPIVYTSGSFDPFKKGDELDDEISKLSDIFKPAKNISANNFCFHTIRNPRSKTHSSRGTNQYVT